MCRIKMEIEYEVDSCIRGYHIYQEQWSSYVGESLSFTREANNTEDPYTVAVVKGNDTIVGHVPRKISAVCWLFLGHGSITCTVTSARRFSSDLPQGGLEVPCKLLFKGPKTFVRKVKKLVVPMAAPAEEPSSKRRRVDSNGNHDDSVKLVSPRPWLSLDSGCCLSEDDKTIISSGAWLTDQHMNFTQKVLKNQFPCLNGLQSTLLLSKPHCSMVLSPTNYLQIVHTWNNHWIAISTLGSKTNEVKIYDSLYSDVDEQREDLIKGLFGADVSIQVTSSPRQQGHNDCGLYAIANCVSLVNWCDPANYVQEKMRPHFIKCLEQFSFTLFPMQ